MNNFYLITTWFFLVIIYILFYFKVTKRACEAVIIFYFIMNFKITMDPIKYNDINFM